MPAEYDQKLAEAYAAGRRAGIAEMQSAGIITDKGAAPLVGTGEIVLLPRALAEEIHGDLCDLRAEWQWKKDEPRAGNAREYAALETRLDRLGAILHGQENDKHQPTPASGGGTL